MMVRVLHYLYERQNTDLEESRSDEQNNPDSGAMASFVVFHMLGLYPLPATREFLISSPFFRTVRIRNPLFGTTTTIRTHGIEGMGNVCVGALFLYEADYLRHPSPVHFGPLAVSFSEVIEDQNCRRLCARPKSPSFSFGPLLSF